MIETLSSVMDHKKHTFEYCVVVAPETKKTLQEDLVPLKEMSARLSEAVDVICTTKHKIKAQGRSVICDIKILLHLLEKRKQ